MPPNQIAHSGNFGLLNSSADVSDHSEVIAPTKSSHLPQNWVLDRVQDSVFIIGAPLISLALAILAMQLFGAARGAAMMITAHIVMTVAHHMPTFIRIYGDVELFQRFKWSFVLGPVIPTLIAAIVLLYINTHNYPVEYFLYLYIFLSLWDPWHFLRQHFGFMRVYDRNNAAPKALASNMDWAISAIWFVHVMVASADWLPGLLEDLYRNVHFPLLLIWPGGLLSELQIYTWWLAVFTSVAYGYYLFWCLRCGFYVSKAKIGLLVITFGVMYLTYTPNSVILQLVPAWGFKVGFATLGIVHMTQYMAIVWRYDSRIAKQGRARSKGFSWFHSRRTRLGIGAAAGCYLLFCLAYGEIITSSFENRWLMSTLLAIGFTSTLMHYYFDGFIWRVRHQQNREALDLNNSPSAQNDSASGSSSWWHNAKQQRALPILGRQLLYFGLPMALFSWGALQVWSSNNQSYIQQMYAAQTLSQSGQNEAAAAMARQAFRSMQRELPVDKKLLELKPTAAAQARLAFLIYNHALYQYRILPALDGLQSNGEQLYSHRQQIAIAVDMLLRAVDSGGDLSHAGREQLNSAQAAAIAASWRAQLR